MSDRTRPGFAFWATVLLVVVVLYVLSSGPTRMVAIRRHSSFMGQFEITSQWYSTFYKPLHWVSGKPWGTPLSWYWSLFPISDT